MFKWKNVRKADPYVKYGLITYVVVFLIGMFVIALL